MFYLLLTKIFHVLFAISTLSLIGLFAFGKTIAGQRCWYAIERFHITTSECQSCNIIGTSQIFADVQINLKEVNRQIQVLIIIYQ
jgi:rod shape determining protein RodA